MPVIHLLLAVYYLLAGPVLGALSVALLVRVTGAEGLLFTAWGLALWPVLYFLWLVLTLAVCALDVQVWSRTLWQRPSRLDTSAGLWNWWRGYLTLSLIARGRLVMSLPGVKYLQLVPLLRQLVFLSYAPRTNLGRDSMVFGFLYDPDQVWVGEAAVLGAGSIISTHSFIANAGGGFTYHSAPVEIGPRAIIGGESRLALGVRVGADAIVEPASNVLPHTVIPDGEVWGGHPAAFVRMRDPRAVRTTHPGPVAAATAFGREKEQLAVQVLVARALGIDPAQVHPEFSRNDAAEWDSLGQMAVAAALHARFGLNVPTEVCFALNSIPAIERFLRDRPVAPRDDRFELPGDPELLPLLDHQQVTRALLSGPDSNATAPKPLRIVVAASFTAEPLAQSLRHWSLAFGIAVDLEFAGFNQIQQQLRDPQSLVHNNRAGISIVLTRPEDLWPASGDPAAAIELLDAITDFAHAHPDRLAVASLPRRVLGQAADKIMEEQQRQNWNRQLAGVPGIAVLDFAAIVDRLGTERSANASGETLAGIPYSDLAYQELGILIARQARLTVRPRKKVIVLDCDGVLWGGVLGEDSESGIVLGESGAGREFQQFQRRLLELRSQGVLLAVCSRNELEDVQQVFASHPGMILRPEHISAWQVSWRPKSAGLADIARTLNLGTDALVFLDDDPANHLEVQAHLPGVTVAPLGEARTFILVLDRLWCFDSPRITAEDLRRGEMLREEQDREQSRSATGDLQSWLRSLDLQVTIRPAEAEDLPRAAQLTQKTNQFNFSLKRRTLAEIQSFPEDHAVLLVQVRDRYGDYGVVGLTISRPMDEELLIDTFLLSCRALGRGVEQAMLDRLRQEAANRGLSRLVADLTIGPRNGPARDFATAAGFVPVLGSTEKVELTVGTASLSAQLASV